MEPVIVEDEHAQAVIEVPFLVDQRNGNDYEVAMRQFNQAASDRDTAAAKYRKDSPMVKGKDLFSLEYELAKGTIKKAFYSAYIDQMNSAESNFVESKVLTPEMS